MLALLLTPGPVTASENVEIPTPVESKQSCTEAAMSLKTRLVRVLLLWTFPHVLPVDTFCDSAAPRQQPAPLVGHTLSSELLAPLRC